MQNQVNITGKLIGRKVLRHTPAGVPVAEATLQHTSEQLEAEVMRQVSMEVSLIALGQTARWLDAAPLANMVSCSGFLAPRSRHSKTLILHLQQITFLEGK